MLNSTMKKSKQKAGNSKSNVKSTSSLTRSNESDEDFRSTVSDETTIPIDKKKAITKSNKPKVDDDDGHQDQDEDFRCKDTTPPKLLFHEEPSMTNENRNVKVLAEIPVPNSIGVASDIEDFPCENPSPPPETYYDDDSQTIKVQNANDKKNELYRPPWNGDKHRCFFFIDEHDPDIRGAMASFRRHAGEEKLRKNWHKKREAMVKFYKHERKLALKNMVARQQQGQQKQQGGGGGISEEKESGPKEPRKSPHIVAK